MSRNYQPGNQQTGSQYSYGYEYYQSLNTDYKPQPNQHAMSFGNHQGGIQSGRVDPCHRNPRSGQQFYQQPHSMPANQPTYQYQWNQPYQPYQPTGLFQPSQHNQQFPTSSSNQPFVQYPAHQPPPPEQGKGFLDSIKGLFSSKNHRGAEDDEAERKADQESKQRSK